MYNINQIIIDNIHHSGNYFLIYFCSFIIDSRGEEVEEIGSCKNFSVLSPRVTSGITSLTIDCDTLTSTLRCVCMSILSSFLSDRRTSWCSNKLPLKMTNNWTKFAAELLAVLLSYLSPRRHSKSLHHQTAKLAQPCSLWFARQSRVFDACRVFLIARIWLLLSCNY